MPGQFRNAVLLALSLGISATAAPVWAETFLKIDSILGETTGMALNRFPGETFTAMQLRSFRSQGIVTAGDLIAADPALVGRIMGVSPQQARMTQKQMRQVMRAERPTR